MDHTSDNNKDEDSSQRHPKAPTLSNANFSAKIATLAKDPAGFSDVGLLTASKAVCGCVMMYQRVCVSG